MIKSILFSSTLLIGSLCAHGQTDINIRIAKFKDNKDCAISYTFDDGLKEQYSQVWPWFKKLHWKGTFVINGGRINQDETHIRDTGRMSWPELKEMAADSQEISNHGWVHKNFGKFSLEEIKEDIVKNDSAIFKNIGIMPRTFAYPNNTKTPEGIKLASENRVSTRLFQRSLGGKSTTENLESWVIGLLRDHEWGVTMTHGIYYGYDHFTDPGILWEHLEKVKAQEDKIWVATFLDVSSYIAERDSTILKTVKKGKGIFQISPICSLNKALFTERLTAIVTLKNNEKVVVYQSGRPLNIIRKQNESLFDFDPFGGAIELRFQGGKSTLLK